MGPRAFRRRPGIAMLLVALWTLLSSPAHALDPGKWITQYLQTTWNTTTGLPQSTVLAIAQTSNGYIWLGTEEGLARFDGARFRVFTRRNTPGLPSNYIQALRACSDGGLWIGTDTGLSHYRPELEAGPTGGFQTLTTANGLSSNNVTALVEDHAGDLWVGTSLGLDRIHEGHVQTWTVSDGLADNAVSNMALDAGGTLWIGTEKGLSRFENGRFVTFTTRDGLPSDIVTALTTSPDGSVWVGTLADRVTQIRNGKVMVLDERLPWSEINALLADRDGALWIAFDHHGIGRLYHGRLDLYGAARGLPSNRCSSILFEDREGSLWVGTQDAGVVQFRDGKFTVFGKPEGLSGNYIDSVIQAQDGTMWIAADTDGVNHLLANGKVEVWNQSKGLPNQEAFSILQTRDGALWIGYRRGTLAELRNGRITVYRDPSAADSGLLTLFQDREGRMWVGFGGKGLAQFDHGRFRHITDTGQVRSIVESPDGALWIALDGEGVARRYQGSVTHYTTADGLAGNHVMCVYAEADGTIWAGTADGLSRIRDGHVVSWGPQQGLPDSAVGSVIEDNLGNLWIGGDAGIARIALKELNETAGTPSGPVHPVLYGTSDGLRTRETLYGTGFSTWKSRDGRLWFSTILGAAVIDPAHIPVNHVVPPVWIERVTFDSRAVPLHDGLRLGPGSGNLEVTFTAPSFVAPQQVRFRYRLNGFDQDWIYTASRRSAWYTNLPPGSYNFEIDAANSDGIWNNTGASFSFVLRPRITRTPLAWFCYVALALLLAWGVLSFRTRNLLRRHKELSQTVAERTAQLESEKSALEVARHALHIQATHDSLTGLFNRAAILEHLHREIARAHREKTPLTVAIADLDHFKSLNDNYGHLCGDDTIREAADRFRSAMRGYDLAGRYGGEEFLMLLPGLDPRLAPSRVNELLEAIRSRPFAVGDAKIHVTCSIGVATFRPDTETPTDRELLSRADTALYVAKKAGRNQVVFELLGIDETTSR